MPTRPLPPLADLLPGTWRVVATTFPMWLAPTGRTPRRLSPVFTYGLRSADPLELDDTVSWFTRRGSERTLLGVDRPRGDGLRWRGTGLLSVLRSDWSVTGASEGEDLIAIRFSRTLTSPPGVDVLVRDGTMIEDIREELADEPHWLGLTDAEAEALVWLRDLPG